MSKHSKPSQLIASLLLVPNSLAQIPKKINSKVDGFVQEVSIEVESRKVRKDLFTAILKD